MNGIGYILRRLRKEKGITQRVIYTNLCSRKQLSRIENNTSFPSVISFISYLPKIRSDNR